MSVNGPSEKWRDVRDVVAIESKAEVTRTSPEDRKIRAIVEVDCWHAIIRADSGHLEA